MKFNPNKCEAKRIIIFHNHNIKREKFHTVPSNRCLRESQLKKENKEKSRFVTLKMADG